jgi:prepilin-type processing-associated H-X9-DG protein
MLFHYALNRRVNGIGDAQRSRIASAIPNPASLVWLYDNGGLAAVAAEGNSHTNLHGGGAQFLFLDGHVTRFPAAAYWDIARRRPLKTPKDLRWMP